MKKTIKDETFTNHVAERITLNSVLSSRVYLADTRKYAENLEQISAATDFSVDIDQKATFNEQYTEALNAELFSYFNPIALEELLENSRNPNLKIKEFIVTNNPKNEQERFYISDKYIIKYFEGVFKISPNTNFDILQYVAKVQANGKPTDNCANFQRMPKNIIEEIDKLEPRFSFGLYNSVDNITTEQGLEKQRTFHIAFRGTEPDIASVGNKDVNKSEFIKYFSEDYPNMNSHYEVIKPFVEQAIKFSAMSGISNLEATGHSLGGSMVDLFLEKNKDNEYLQNMSYQGYAFGNPFGISTRTKVEQFFAGHTGQKIKQKIDDLMNIDAENAVNEFRKKVRQTGKNFVKIGVNAGIALGCTLTRTESNDVTQHYMKNLAKQFVIGIPSLLSSAGIRCVCNFAKVAKQTFTPEKIVDENFKQVENNPDSRLISIQHSGDPVPMAGTFLYQHKGTRYFVKDKNDVYVDSENADKKLSFKQKVLSLTGKAVKTVLSPLALGYNIKNHKAYNYVASCVQRVDFSTNTHLAQAIRNVNHTFEIVTPQFERTKDCKEVFANIKKMRNLSHPVTHSVDKQIPF